MMEWKPIKTAPKNPEGSGVGPWILIWSEWDHGIYQARWECRAEVGRWKVRGIAGAVQALAPDNARFWCESGPNPK